MVQAVWMYKAILYTAVNYISYCVSLIMVTITRHLFNNIFQMKQTAAVTFKWVNGIVM